MIDIDELIKQYSQKKEAASAYKETFDSSDEADDDFEDEEQSSLIFKPSGNKATSALQSNTSHELFFAKRDSDAINDYERPLQTFKEYEEEAVDNSEQAREYIDSRMSMNTIIIFTIVFAWFFIMLLIFPRETFSESEKRELAVFPKFSFKSFFSGEFTDGISLYYSDTVPFRESIKTMSNAMTEFFGVRYDNVKLHGVVIPPTEENVFITSGVKTDALTDEDVENTSVPTISLSTNSTIPNDIEEYDPNDEENTDIVNNGILVVNNQGLMLYGGGLSAGTNYAQYINKYRQQLVQHINIYNMVIPTSVEFYLPSSYSGYSASELSNINNIYNNLSSSINSISVYDTLKSHIDEKIYFRTDHHWTSIGAFYAAQQFCTEAGVIFKSDLDKDYDKVTVNNFVGSLYGYTNDIALKNNPEDFTYYKPKNSYKTTYYYYEYPNAPFTGSLFNTSVSLGNFYCVYMGGDNLVTKIETDVNNGRKLAVFKDSYGNALIPFLVGSFEEIHVLDIRYFPHNAIDYINYYGITDVLFANNIFAATSSLGRKVDIIRTQSDFSGQSIWGGTITPPSPPEETTATTTSKPADTTTSSTAQSPITLPPDTQTRPPDTQTRPPDTHTQPTSSVTRPTDPTTNPTTEPTSEPTGSSTNPTSEPTSEPDSPSTNPTSEPTSEPDSPSTNPTSEPTSEPDSPSTNSTSEPTSEPDSQSSSSTSE